MRIGINAQILTDGKTGVTRFAKNIALYLPRIGFEHTFIIFGNPKDCAIEGSNVILVPTSDNINTSTKRILWEQFVLPRLLKKWNVDVMYFPDSTGMLFQRFIKSVITIHDIAPFAVPQTFSVLRRYYKQMSIQRASRHATKIIAVSQATKSEIINCLKVPEENIHVVHCGIEDSIYRISDTSKLNEVRNRYKIAQPFILFVGSLEKRKNIVRMLKAFARGNRENRWPHKLVLVGGPGHGYSEIQQTIIDEKIENEVLMTGYVHEIDLLCLYSLADVLVYPSLYEGFGFPPLEAMRCGCPVIASNATSLPEVIGDAGILVDPKSVDELYSAIHTLFSDIDLRHVLIEKGMRRSAMFTWDKTAKNIIDVITSV
jgi:glycosyltransferase involved in cell wall biosynthesis